MALDDPNSNGGSQGVDRLSGLPDDILVLVLERLRGDARLLARTRLLSRRWRALPLVLPRLAISANTFLPASPPGSTTLPVRCLHEATSKFTDALRFFLLAAPGGQVRDIGRHTLAFSLTKHRRRLHEIGRLVSGAVGRGEVRALEVALDTAEDTSSVRAMGDDAVPRGYARRFMRLFRAAPAGVVGCALTRLSLRNLCFRRAPDLEGVLRACEALETLHLTYCWFASWSALTVDAPRSRLRELWITECYMERIDLVRAPELLRLTCEKWFSEACPVRFSPASAPSLGHMTLASKAAPGQVSFKLSELLENANPVENLCLDFDAGKIWVEPEERRNLVGAAFSRLKKLHLRNIFPAADISWTLFLIEAAPLLELIDIHVRHCPVCSESFDAGDDGDEDDAEALEWDVSAVHYSEHRHLQEVRIRGGIDAGKDARFVRLVLQRAVNLKLLLLDARVACAACMAARRQDPSIAVFPEDKGASKRL